MGDCSWKKIVLARSNNKWITTIKKEKPDEPPPSTTAFSLEEQVPPFRTIKIEHTVVPQEEPDEGYQLTGEPVSMMQELDPLEYKASLKRRSRKKSTKSESSTGRESRLAKMSAYAARRLANELPEQREARLRRMSEYAARRLSQETAEQRASRLARMSAYAAKRLANETTEQRQARLTRMSAYAAKRHAMKKEK